MVNLSFQSNTLFLHPMAIKTGIMTKKEKSFHFPVDNYYYEGQRQAIFLGEEVIKYHRTLTTYLNTLLEKDLNIQHVIEPKPPKI